jgi:Tfp pilus assembly protein PilV
MANQEEIEKAEAERRTIAQLLSQTDSARQAHEDGWITDDAYAEIQAERDSLRADLAKADAAVVAAGGESMGFPEKKGGDSLGDRMSTMEDATADLSEYVSANAASASDIADAVAELSKIVSDIKEAK